MIARPAERRRRQVANLPALVVLATMLVAVATALFTAAAALAPVPVGGLAGPVLGAATSAPDAVAGRSDNGPFDLDLLSGHSVAHRSADAVTGWPVPAFAFGAHTDGDARRFQGRAPPRAR